MKNYKKSIFTGIVLAAISGCQSQTNDTQVTQLPPSANDVISQQLATKALSSTLGYDIVESLTVEVGPRLAGSEKDLIAVEWAMNKLKSLGFDKVYKESVQVPAWSRGHAQASIVSPFEQPLVISALGGSVATPESGLQAQIVRFDTLAALQVADPALVEGKIVFIDHKTERHISGKGYGQSVGGRSRGAVAAAEKGAVAVVIRSIGTDHDRMAHTGMMRYKDGVAKIPAAALSAPDADMINAMLKRDKNISLSLNLSSKNLGVATSYNVIAEVTGSSKAEEVVLIGAHLDSWDEGTGAIDDGAGVAIVTAAAKLIQDLPQKPARTIRVVLYAAEEVGLVGGKAYAKQHADELVNHYIAAESDFGAGKIYQIDFNVNPHVFEQVKTEHSSMTINGVKLGNNNASGGPDVSMMPSLGVPVASLRQDGTDYFDYHHTPNDTLDKIDPTALAQNVAAYAQFAYIMAQSELNLRPLAKKADKK
ncbi:M20/M25/M40 family metallo-hydrolase [Shewanella sp. 5_MG-2023]|uniref:M20/M25/M40 family metallo-hydrolase n=1 Tax=unclassified Shewanella TaxID=196818 RepID=UPI0026E3A610|nr:MULTISPECIES: M20/M25/M40 family metallo-hydrolase [unclassified Shewanella]MDO6638736.1 M20/M25/M40 family metallo-hydrolase [Shewanella sp. 5_MG-2023]MDO6679832.1 M20/M25/M40 family metallo-hydrolase [Shewanella sp. 4_MG-2023]